MSERQQRGLKLPEGTAFVQVETSLLRDPGITSQAKALYALLLSYGPMRIFPKHNTLAESMKVSRLTISRWMNELKDLGLVTWDQDKGRSNHYRLFRHDGKETCIIPDTGGVSPTIQGCIIDDTGGVSPVIPDLDPVPRSRKEKKKLEPDWHLGLAEAIPLEPDVPQLPAEVVHWY